MCDTLCTTMSHSGVGADSDVEALSRPLLTAYGSVNARAAAAGCGDAHEEGTTPGQTIGGGSRHLQAAASGHARVAEEEADELEARDTKAACVLITAKTILGAGMAALPHAFALSGLLVGTGFLLAVAWMTLLTVQILTRCSESSGAFSYSGVMQVAFGSPATIALQLCLLLRTAGLMVVYMVVVGDVLAGNGKEAGLLCDLAGGAQSAQWWCANRPLVIFVVLLLVIAPLVSFGKLENTAWASKVGMAGILVWCSITLMLCSVALATGQAQPLAWLPDVERLGGSAGQVLVQLIGIIPVIGTAYTCQMTAHFIMSCVHPWSVSAMDDVTHKGINLCSAAFLVVSIGSLLVFGVGVPADVLSSFNAQQLTPILGKVGASAAYILVRVGYLASIVTIYPMQMLPFREALFKLVLRRPPSGMLVLPITYACMLLLYVIGIHSKSIWLPVQLIGATAGALIAFIFPGMLTLKPERFGLSRQMRYGGWLLIAVGVLQGITGVASVILNLRKARENSNALPVTPLFF